MLSAGSTFTGEPIFHCPFTGACPTHRHLDRTMRFTKFLVQRDRHGGAIVRWFFDQVHKCAHLRHNCAHLHAHFHFLLS